MRRVYQKWRIGHHQIQQTGVGNKETITNNHYQKLVMKNYGRKTDFANGIMKINYEKGVT
jgi:hypothetical protein